MRDEPVGLKSLIALLALLCTMVLAANGYVFSAIKENKKSMDEHIQAGSHKETDVKLAEIQATLEYIKLRLDRNEYASPNK